VSTSLAASLALVLALFSGTTAQILDDPSVRAVVDRYYRAIEAEDIDAYLALWSKTAAPQRQSVEFLFKFIDDRFSDIQITRAIIVQGRLRVRVSLRRERTRTSAVAGGAPTVHTAEEHAALTFVKEDEAWKVVSEGDPSSDLAGAIAQAANADDREALLAAEPELVDRLLVVALSRIASNAAASRQYPRAQAIFELAVDLARRTKSRKEEGEALQNLGNTHYFQRRFSEALTSYEERLALERDRGDDAAMAAALVGMGTIRYALAEYTDALKHYRLALAIHERLDDRFSSASTLISTGNVRYLQGDYAGAIRDYSASRDLYRSFAYTDGEARALEGLGRTYAAQGDYAAALTAYAGVLAEGKARNDWARQGSATRSLGDVHLRLGNADAARKFYEESRDHFMATKDLSSAGRVWQGLGMTELLAGKVEAAEAAYTRSATLCDGIEDAECVAHAQVGLGFAQFAQEKFEESIASYEKGISGFTTLGSREAAARAEVGLSQAFTGVKNFTAALAASERARHAAIALNNDDVLWRALMADARALRRRGEAAAALAAARAAVTVVERMQESALRKPATAIPADAEAVFATLAVLQAEAGDSAAASTSATRMRALHLRNALAVNEREIARGMTPEERETERVTAAELLSLLAQVARLRGLPKPDKAKIAALEERIDTATTARQRWMEQLYSRLPDLHVWRGLLTAPSDSDLTGIVGAGTTVLEFIVDDEDMVILVASADPENASAVYTTPIRRRTLTERVNALLQAPVLRDAARWRKSASPIAELLPAPVWKALAAASRVVVIPHDILWRLPFEAMPLADGYLGDGAEIVYAGSRAALRRAVAASSAPVKTVVATAAPEIGAAMKERLQQTAPGWNLRGPERAVDEARAVSAIYGEEAATLIGADATEAAIVAGAANASVLHIASPFRINGASPLFSPVLVSPSASGEAERDSFELREVMNVKTAAAVAILSDGAATSMLDGAAASDVVEWGWLAAGVPAVVVARWSTEVQPSNVLLAEFHRRLLKGAEPATALRFARAEVRKKAEWTAPFFWAGWLGLGR
jgi:tetratricopeptide (TPR) repeat protein